MSLFLLLLSKVGQMFNYPWVWNIPMLTLLGLASFSSQANLVLFTRSLLHSWSNIIHTWSFHAIAKVVSKFIHNVQQEGEVCHVVHVYGLWVRGNGPQLVLISVLNAYTRKPSQLAHGIISCGESNHLIFAHRWRRVQCPDRASSENAQWHRPGTCRLW